MTRQVTKSLESVPPLLFHTNSLSPEAAREETRFDTLSL